MATHNSDSFTLPAGADLTTKYLAFGKTAVVNSALTVVACSVLGERADCVIFDAVAAGIAVNCMPDRGRLVSIRVGAVAVAAGDELTPDANGLAKTAVSTNIVRAKAVEAGAAGAQIRILWVDSYAKP
jgi:hypothetical protein